MRIGIPKEIKSQEYRVAATPTCVAAYVSDGHAVVVERGAGAGAGFADDTYQAAGATLVASAADVWQAADMIIKVKEPLPSEYPYLRSDQLLFTFLHLAAVPALAETLVKQSVSAVAYETITDIHGRLPCLVPMSAIAGRLSVQEGAKYLEKPFGGRGVLLAGVPGAPRGRVLVLGGGMVGTQAAKMAIGLGADVTIVELAQRRLYELDDLFFGRAELLQASEATIGDALTQADLVVGAVLVPGAAAPKLVRREHLSTMKPGAVIVDVAVDQGGCAETTHPTTHEEPTFEVDGVQHYCVANMPGAVPLTSTLALTAATLPYGRRLAKLGLEAALAADSGLRDGLNAHQGAIVHPAVAEALAKA